MTEPSNNNPPFGDLPKQGAGTHEEHLGQRSSDISFTSDVTKEQEIDRLVKELAVAKKKLALVATQATTRGQNVKALKDSIKLANETYASTTRRLKAEIDGLKIAKKSIQSAFSNSTKIASDASKELVSKNKKEVLDHRRKVLGLERQISGGIPLRVRAEKKSERLAAEVNVLQAEKIAWVKREKFLSRKIVAFKKKDTEQVKVKYSHQLQMAEIALQSKQVTLAQAKQKQANVGTRNMEMLEQRKAYSTWNYEQRDIAKVKDIERKEELKDLKTQKVWKRLQIVPSDMIRTNQLNGGSFPSPALSLQNVSIS